MITAEQIGEILSLYEKHGWKISRVLLSEELSRSLGEETRSELFGPAPTGRADIDAVWFTRPSKHGRTAWELRHLSAAPYALFELSGETGLTDETMKEMENRLTEYASKITGH